MSPLVTQGNSLASFRAGNSVALKLWSFKAWSEPLTIKRSKTTKKSFAATAKKAKCYKELPASGLSHHSDFF